MKIVGLIKFMDNNLANQFPARNLTEPEKSEMLILLNEVSVPHREMLRRYFLYVDVLQQEYLDNLKKLNSK